MESGWCPPTKKGETNLIFLGHSLLFIWVVLPYDFIWRKTVKVEGAIFIRLARLVLFVVFFSMEMKIEGESISGAHTKKKGVVEQFQTFLIKRRVLSVFSGKKVVKKGRSASYKRWLH